MRCCRPYRTFGRWPAQLKRGSICRKVVVLRPSLIVSKPLRERRRRGSRPFCIRWVNHRSFRDHLVDKVGNEPGPARLVRSAAAAAVVAMEVLVEEDVVIEIGIGLELFVGSKNGAPPVGTTKEELYQAATQLIGDFVERQHDA